MSASRAPRILFCTDTYPPQVNGVSVVTALSVTGLAARGWECAVIAPRYPAVARDAFAHDVAYRSLEGGLTIPSAPLPLYPDIRIAAPQGRAVARCIDRFDPDLIHCATEFVIGELAGRAARRRGIPVTTSYHTDFAKYADAYGVPALKPLVARHLARFHRRALRTFTPSVAAAGDLVAMGVPHPVVWGRGVDVDAFHPSHRSTVLRAAYGRSDTCLFLHVGRLAPEKGVDRVIAAYELARRQLPEGAVHLVLAGSGPRERDLRAMGAEHITFLGNLDRATVLPRLYASADAFVFASLTETLGLVVLEAMASGLPVVAAPAGGVADHLRHDLNGRACAPGDVDAMARELVALALNPGLRRRLSVGARATAEALSWSAELDRLDKTCRELLQGGEVAEHAPAVVAA